MGLSAIAGGKARDSAITAAAPCFGHDPARLAPEPTAMMPEFQKESGSMHPTDSIRNSGYVVALVFGLIAMFALMTGNGWTAAGSLLVAVAMIALVERITELKLRSRSAAQDPAHRGARLRLDDFAPASHQGPEALGTLT